MTLSENDVGEGSRVALGILDRKLRIIAADEVLAALMAGAPDRAFVDLLPDADRARIRAGLTALVAGGPASLRAEVGGAQWCRLVALRLSVGARCGAVTVALLGDPSAAWHPAEPVPVLGEVELRVVEGIARGESTAQLAVRLFLSRSGVEYHVGRLLRRFRVRNRAALISRVHALGLMCTCCWPPRAADGHANPS